MSDLTSINARPCESTSNITNTLPFFIKNKVLKTAKNICSPYQLAKYSNFLPKILVHKMIEFSSNRIFEGLIEDQMFEFLNDKILQIDIIDAQLFIGLSYKNSRIVCSHFNQEQKKANVTLSISSIDAIKILEQEIDPDTLFFQRKLKIQGETELAHEIKNTIDNIDPDVIPQLVRYLMVHYKELILS